jgi:di/tripeptidase
LESNIQNIMNPDIETHNKECCRHCVVCDGNFATELMYGDQSCEAHRDSHICYCEERCHDCGQELSQGFCHTCNVKRKVNNDDLIVAIRQLQTCLVESNQDYIKEIVKEVLRNLRNYVKCSICSAVHGVDD